MWNWEYRSLNEIVDINQVVDLEIVVWRIDYRGVVPSRVLQEIVYSGGLLVGAYDSDRLIGMALAFPGRRGKTRMLWSHMIGVHPDYQNRGVGFGLKQFQRDWALRHGYSLMAWVFDPLQSGLANFNLHCLGVLLDVYHVNFCGAMLDGIMSGVPSDCIEVIWNLRSQRVKVLVSGKQSVMTSSVEAGDVFLLRVEDGRVAVDLSFQDSLSRYCVEIPVNYVSLEQSHPDVACAWRVALRETLQGAFSRGFAVCDFVRQRQRCWYVLSASRPWFLYVLECSDLSLYTGITPDLERRLVLHNLGRGAAYTASRRPVTLVAAWRFRDQRTALGAENMFKGLSRQVKLRFVWEQSPYCGEPFISFHLPW